MEVTQTRGRVLLSVTTVNLVIFAGEGGKRKSYSGIPNLWSTELVILSTALHGTLQSDMQPQPLHCFFKSSTILSANGLAEAGF